MAVPPRHAGSSRTDGFTRRRFLAGAGAAAVGLSAMAPGLAQAAAPGRKVALGIVGCGGRGSWIAGLFVKHGGFDVVALADYFPERVQALGDRLGVAAASRFTGLSAYRRLLEQKLDAVAIESPPFFHPTQAADAVAAGKHVYLAKPIAVDAPGCVTIEEAAAKATAGGLCFLVDFQTRANDYFIEAVRRVHGGAIGRFAFGEATYHAEDPFEAQAANARSDSPEDRLRAWGLSRELSGDIITEQNIHALDVASWIMGQPPLRAYGTGGRKVRDAGSCWDTFSVVFEYPGRVGIAFSSRQFNGHGTRPEGIRNRMFGTEGVLETEYGGQVLIRGQQFYRGGQTSAIYEEGAVRNVAAFYDGIQNGEYGNNTVAESVRSNLVTILGRTAAYEGRLVTWEEVVRSGERLVPDLNGLKD
ncbi:MAG: Myo-inositol 2-dehydrogenase [Acidobacteria bacterium]|nr:Myo-inositol 2-dehydrogenase [Acidobacteriota bacterium]